MLAILVNLIFASLLARVCLSKVVKHSSQDDNFQMSTPNTMMKLLQSKNKEIVKDLITAENKNLGPALKMINLEGFKSESVSGRRDTNKFFMQCLIEVKMGRGPALVWLKRHVDFQVCNVIFTDLDYSGTWIQVFMGKINTHKKSMQTILAQKIKDKCNNCIKAGFKISYNGLQRLALVTLTYTDLSLDSILLFAILNVLGSTLADHRLFSTQIAFLLLASIVIPAMMTAIIIALKRPLVVVSYNQWIRLRGSNEIKYWKRLLILRVLIICLFPLVPALIMMSDEKAKHKKTILKDKSHQKNTDVQDSDLEELELLDDFIDECRLALLTFKRNELSIELVTQLSIHLTMVLLSQTKYPI